MSTLIPLSIKMFGAFRQYHQGILNVEVPSGCDIRTLKCLIADALRQTHLSFDDVELMNQSAIADHQRVYREDEQILTACALAILPPVCGG